MKALWLFNRAVGASNTDLIDLGFGGTSSLRFLGWHYLITARDDVLLTRLLTSTARDARLLTLAAL